MNLGTEQDQIKAAKAVAKTALAYREGNADYAWLDVQAALDGVPGAINRLGSDPLVLGTALYILGMTDPAR